MSTQHPRVGLGIVIENNKGQILIMKREGNHAPYWSIPGGILLVKTFEGEPKIMEPDKCTELRWVAPHNLPQPHFDASELGIRCYLQGVPYVNKLG